MKQKIETTTEKEFRRLMLFGDNYQVVKPRKYDGLTDVFCENVSRIKELLFNLNHPFGYFNSHLVYDSAIWVPDPWETVGKKYNGERHILSFINGEIKERFNLIIDRNVFEILTASVEEKEYV
jgi:hypothetical protein